MIYDYQGLLKSQKNEMLETVRKVGFDPNDFEWFGGIGRRGGRDYEISTLVYKKSPYFYMFDVEGERYQCRRCPGVQNTTDRDEPHIWEQVVPDFIAWLKRLKSELDTPDLWAETQKYQSIFYTPLRGQGQDIPFSKFEVEQIANALKQVEKRIIEDFKPTKEQIEFIRHKLSYLESTAKKAYGRVDWLHILISVLMTIAVNLALSPQKAHQLLVFFREAMGSIVSLLK